jgi:hypothetical protein
MVLPENVLIVVSWIPRTAITPVSVVWTAITLSAVVIVLPVVAVEWPQAAFQHIGVSELT